MITVATMAACTTEQTPIENTEWKLVELYGKSNELFAAEPDSFFFQLSTENGLNGVGSCNRFFGNYTLSATDSILIEPMGLTRMMCPNIELEDEFVKMFYEVNTYSIDKRCLSLFNEGVKVAEFEAVAAEK